MTRSNKFYVGLGVLAGSLLVAPHAWAEPSWWTQQKSDCGLSSSLAYNDWDGECGGGGGGGGSAGSAYDYEAANRAQIAASQAAAEKAAAEEQQRLQDEAALIERQRVEAEKAAKFIADRDSAVGMLKGSSGSSGSAMSQLKGLSGVSDPGLKGSSPHTDTSVVDARDVPSGLSKGMDGVIDRVRKGFQAVMERDWKAAKAWFQEALKRDPNNAFLKRLVALVDLPQKSNLQIQLPVYSDQELLFNPNDQPSSKKGQDLQLPDPRDISPWRIGEPEPVFKTMPDGTRVQLPQDSDQELLFDPDNAGKQK